MTASAKNDLLRLMRELSMPEEVISAADDLCDSPRMQELFHSPLFAQLQKYETAKEAYEALAAALDMRSDGLDMLVLQLGVVLCQDPVLFGSEFFVSLCLAEAKTTNAVLPNASAEELQKEHGLWSGQNIDRSIVIETLKAFTRFVQEYDVSYGSYGFDRGFWTIRQINGVLFRIGTLEYELDFVHRCIAVHIPGDASLKEADLQDSLRKQAEFFRLHFPEESSWPRTCESWLLSPALAELLPPESHILQFQKLFTITRVDEEADDYLEWVFHYAAAQQDAIRTLLADPSDESHRKLVRLLPEKTSLQRGMKARILQGGKIGIGEGVLTQHFQERD